MFVFHHWFFIYLYIYFYINHLKRIAWSMVKRFNELFYKNNTKKKKKKFSTEHPFSLSGKDRLIKKK